MFEVTNQFCVGLNKENMISHVVQWRISRLCVADQIRGICTCAKGNM